MFGNINRLQFFILLACTKLALYFVKRDRFHQAFNNIVVIPRCLVQYWQIFSLLLPYVPIISFA